MGNDTFIIGMITGVLISAFIEFTYWAIFINFPELNCEREHDVYSCEWVIQPEVGP